MKFFEQQRSARRRTRFYLVWLAILAVPCIASMLIATLFSVWLSATAFLSWLLSFFMSDHEATALLVNGPAVIVSVVIYTALIFWYLVAKKSGQLRRSGEYVAAEIGALRVHALTDETAARRLFNITEEMALAAGIPAPTVYTWPAPGIINAFAVGHTTADAALFVSRGAIDALSRDELQALVGHRMSQVRNGDMALNSRLASYLYAFKFAPRVAKWWLLSPRGEEGMEFVKAVILWLLFTLWIGIALSIITFPQYLGARLMQAAISRERQRLADASAIQFTRNPDALKGLMVKALAVGTASPATPAILDDLAQAFFAGPVRRHLLDTHQPLQKRIRVLDPRFDIARVAEVRREVLEEIARREKTTVAELQRRATAEVARRKRELFVRDAAVGAMTVLARSREAAADDRLTEVTSADDARAALIALLLDRQPEAQRRQFDAVRKRFGESSMAAFNAASAALGPLTPAQRTLALDRQLPALRELSAPELRRAASAILDLEEADEATDVFEYALSREAAVFIADLLEPRDPHGHASLAARADELRAVFSAVAQYGNRRDAAAAFEAGMKTVGLGNGPRFTPLMNWTRPLDQALTQLESLKPIAKELLLEGLQATVKFDGQVSPAESELVRVIAASLHFPIARAKPAV